jgi:CRISPR-associated protein Cas1
MEPYRPFVDVIVRQICSEHGQGVEMVPDIKKKLLGVLSVDVWIEEERKPLLLGLTSTSASLAKCYAKEGNKITYPLMYAP